MKFRVYNENGVVRVVRVLDDGTELSMFSDVKDGSNVTIDLFSNIAYKAYCDGACTIKGKTHGEQ